MHLEVEPQTTAAALKKASAMRPNLAIVLGSGFHPAVDGLRVDKEIPYSEIPGFPKPTVKGHAGKLFFGEVGGTQVMVLSGRSHFYEGQSMEHVTFPVRALAAFGIHDLLLTNAAGGINKSFRAGDSLVDDQQRPPVTDHIQRSCDRT